MSKDAGETGQTALVLIDLQNSFLHPKGDNYYPESSAIVAPLSDLLSAARRSGYPVIFVAERHRRGLKDFESNKLPDHCVAGEFDAELIDGFAPTEPNEFLLEKRRMSAFNATDLDLLLRELDVTQLVLAGVKTNVCVRATVQDGFALGYKCFVVKDAVNSNREHLSEASLEDIGRYMGWVVTLAEGIALLS